MTPLEELESRYSADMSERERGALEAQIWALVPRGTGVRHGLVAYMKDRFGAAQYKSRCRQFLHRAGAAADPLWDRLQSDMSHNAALGVMQAALKDPDSKVSLKDAVLRAIAEHDRLGYAVHLPNGKVVRRKRPSSSDSSGDLPDDVPTGRPFWGFIRKATRAMIEDRLPASDPILKANLLRKFEADLNMVILDFQRELDKAPRAGLEAVIVSRSQLRSACANLGIDPPKPGKLVDPDLARKQWRRNLRAYHPDSNGGSQETRPQYQAANEAYKLIVMYNESLEASVVPAPTTAREAAGGGSDDVGGNRV